MSVASRFDRADALDGSATFFAIVAPAGFGKSTFAKKLALQTEASATSRFRRGIATDEAKLLLTVSQPRDTDAPATLVLDDLDAIYDDPHIVGLIAGTIAASANGQRIVLCSRRPLPAAITRFLVPHQTARYEGADLRLDDRQAKDLIGEADFERILSLAKGWPAGLLALARMRDESVSAREKSWAHLLDYMCNEIVAPLAECERRALFTVAALPHATVGDVVRFAPFPGKAEALAFLRYTALVDFDEDALELNPLLRLALARDFTEALSAIRSEARATFERDGDGLRQAELSLAESDSARAIEVLASSINELSPLSLPRAAAVIEAAGPEAVLASPRLWNDVLQIRRLVVPFNELCDEARRVFYGLVPSVTDSLRAETSLSVAAVFVHAGKAGEALAILEDAATYLSPSSEELAERLRLFEGVVRSQRGAYVESRRIYRELRTAASNASLHFRLLDHIEATMAFRSAEYETGVAMLEEALRLERLHGTPSHLMISLSNLAYESWLVNDERRFEWCIAEMRSIASPVFENAWQFFLNAAAGVASETTGYEIRSVEAIGFVFLASDSADRTREFAQKAVASADACDDVGMQTIARVVFCEVCPDAAAPVLAELRAMAAKIDLVPFRKAVEAYAERREPSGFFAPLVARLRAKHVRPSARVLVQCTTGTVLLDDTPVPLTARESAVVTFLALKKTRVDRTRICDAIWPELESEASSKNLKVLVHRVRKKLGEHAIVFSDGAYALGQQVSSDVDVFDVDTREPTGVAHLDEQKRVRLETLAAALAGRSDAHLRDYEWYVFFDHRLRDTRRSALLSLARDAVSEDDEGRALNFIEPLLSEDPDDEEARNILNRIGATRRRYR